MAILSKRISRVVKPEEYKEFALAHPESHDFITKGIVKGMLLGAGLEAACVAGGLKAKNPIAKAVFAAGGAAGMFLCAAGGYIMGCELEAAEYLEEEAPEDAVDENVEDDLDVEEEPEEPADDDGIIIE